MPMLFTHAILVAGDDFAGCARQARRFLTNTLLVRYDRLTIDPSRATPAAHKDFWPRLERHQATNRATVAELFKELQQEGFSSIGALEKMGQGYHSKTFHTIAHLLDGFFGIDSRFYNLEEDSHWLSDHLRDQIVRDPAPYWLIEVKAESDGGSANQLANLRSGAKSREPVGAD